jgi:predicted nucleic acid-binding protein
VQVLVDTSVWSLALRRPQTAGKHPEQSDAAFASAIAQLRDLIEDGRACIIGAIRQELLSGIKHREQFTSLQTKLRAFEDIALEQQDHERAAEFFNLCRSEGIQGSNTDFLICAAASSRKLPILTTDADFKRYAQHLPIQLFLSQPAFIDSSRPK